MSVDWDQAVRDIARPGGWVQGSNGSYHLASGAVCIRGAIMRQLGDAGIVGCHLDVLRIEGGVLAPIIREQFPERALDCPSDETGVWIPSFNDHPDTTKDDVILVLEKARASETL